MDFLDLHLSKETVDQMFTDDQMLDAKVIWFDASSGEGQIELLDDGSLVYCHYTAIVGMDKNGYVAPKSEQQGYLKGLVGQRCKVALYENLYSRVVEKLTLA